MTMTVNFELLILGLINSESIAATTFIIVMFTIMNNNITIQWDPIYLNPWDLTISDLQAKHHTHAFVQLL